MQWHGDSRSLEHRPCLGALELWMEYLSPSRSLQTSSAQESTSVERATMQFPYKSFAMPPTGFIYVCSDGGCDPRPSRIFG
jgi:hypothetical protein